MARAMGAGMETNMERRKKVLCPVQNKQGNTYWMRVGSAYINADGSTNIYLDAYPANGKLQIRDLDADDIERITRRNGSAPPPQSGASFPLGGASNSFGL